LPGMEREWFPGSLSVGISLLILQWSLAIVGITCKCICVKKLHWVHVCMFLLLGWSSMLIIVDIWKAGPLFFWLIVSGGLCYSLGVIFYAIKKVKYFHFVWHIFVMAGTILHIIAIIMVLYPV
jgi:hemolysin III